MKYVAGLLLFCTFTGLSGCQNQRDCTVHPNERFDGNGLLLLETATSEDGSTFVVFFPVCEVDTADLVGSLRRASEGVSVRVRYGSVLRAMRHRVVRLTSTDPRRPAGLGKLYLTSVHLAFTDQRKPSNPHNKAFPYVLNTEQVRWAGPVSVTQMDALHPVAFDNL